MAVWMMISGLAIAVIGWLWFVATAYALNYELGCFYAVVAFVFGWFIVQPVFVFKNPKGFWQPFLVEVTGLVISFNGLMMIR